MENVKGIFIQYWYEIVAAVMFVLFWIVKHSFLLAFLIGLIAYLAIHLLYFIFYKFAKPQCKVLHLYKNEICMKSQFQNRRKIADDFWDDFIIILQYAKSRERDTLVINTHSMILFYLLQRVTDDMIYKKFLKLSVNETMIMDSNVGKVEITYLGKYVNRCARYQYGLMMSFDEFKRTFRKLDFYHVIIKLGQR